MKIVADEGVERQVVEVLRAAGHDITYMHPSAGLYRNTPPGTSSKAADGAQRRL
jgi:hypothetical protein